MVFRSSADRARDVPASAFRAWRARRYIPAEDDLAGQEQQLLSVLVLLVDWTGVVEQQELPVSSVEHTPVSGSTSWTRRAAARLPASSSAIERTCS